MVFRLFMTRLLAITIAVGLAVAPVAAPAAMHGVMSAGIHDMSDMADMTSMAHEAAMADMPCCPDEQKNAPCPDCPLTAMCMLTTAQATPPESAVMPVRHAIRAAHALRDDVFADGLSRPPPDQPPRHLA